MPLLRITTGLLSACIICMMICNDAVAEEKDLIQAQFEEAMQNRESGKIYDAIQLFENILSTNPYLNRARLELAVAYHEASLYVEAMDQFRIVLDDPATPEPVRIAILAYIGQLYSDELRPESTNFFSAYAKAGVIYNSNINSVPGIGNIIVNGRTFLLPTEKIESFGSDFVISGSHRYRRKKPFNVDGAKTIFEWQSQASLSSNLYTKTSDFNLNVLSADTGPSFISPGRWLGAIPLRVDHVILGGHALVTALSIKPYVSFDMGNYNGILVETEYLTRRYSEAIDEPQDGTRIMGGAGYTTLFQSLNTGMEIGFRFNNRNADDKQFSYDSLTLYFSGYTTFRDVNNVYLKLNLQSYDYQGADTIIDPLNTTLIRNDDETTASLGYSRDIKDGYLVGWTFNTEVSYTSNDSNIDAYDYDRLLFTANLSKYIQ